MNRQEATEILNVLCADHIDNCPHCGAKAHITLEANQYYTEKNGDQVHYLLFRCKPCKKIVLKTLVFEQNPYSSEINLQDPKWLDKYPDADSYVSEKYRETLPKDVLADYEEGLRCLSSNSPRAATSMFRRALQSAMINLGANKDLNLIDQIKSISRLTDDIKDWAHNIRIFGNWGAHPQDDELKDIDNNKASEVKDFIDAFFSYVYVMPNRVATARKEHEKPTDQEVEE